MSPAPMPLPGDRVWERRAYGRAHFGTHRPWDFPRGLCRGCGLYDYEIHIPRGLRTCDRTVVQFTPPAQLHAPAPDDDLVRRLARAIADHVDTECAALMFGTPLTDEASRLDFQLRWNDACQPRRPYTLAELRRHREELECL